MNTDTQTNPAPSSALATLKALAAKKPAPVESPMAAQVNDPAIAGAKRNKNTVSLGFDPSIAEKAAESSLLRQALDDAKTAFEVLQGEMRDYGIEKRKLYNSTFKANVTTVQVPYVVEVPNDQESATPGRETKYVQVICSHKFSVAQDTVLANEAEIGSDLFPRLFNKVEEKFLKPNAEQLIRGLLTEFGVTGDELERSMETLFDAKVKVTAAETYEQEIEKAPEAIRALLDQAVTRSAPGLKYPA